MHFFSEDGSYGGADGILVVDTSQWTADDWREVEDTSDLHRLEVARDIARKYQK